MVCEMLRLVLKCSLLSWLLICVIVVSSSLCRIWNVDCSVLVGLNSCFLCFFYLLLIVICVFLVNGDGCWMVLWLVCFV